MLGLAVISNVIVSLIVFIPLSNDLYFKRNLPPVSILNDSTVLKEGSDGTITTHNSWWKVCSSDKAARHSKNDRKGSSPFFFHTWTLTNISDPDVYVKNLKSCFFDRGWTIGDVSSDIELDPFDECYSIPASKDDEILCFFFRPTLHSLKRLLLRHARTSTSVLVVVIFGLGWLLTKMTLFFQSTCLFIGDLAD